MPLRILRFTETVDGESYTARTSIPKGARLMDVLISTTVAWTAATATVDVGDSDAADALVNGTSVKATTGVTADADTGTDWGADGNPYSSGGAGKLYPAGDLITAVVTAGTPGGPTGQSFVMLWFEPTGAGQAATAAVAP